MLETAMAVSEQKLNVASITAGKRKLSRQAKTFVISVRIYDLAQGGCFGASRIGSWDLSLPSRIEPRDRLDQTGLTFGSIDQSFPIFVECGSIQSSDGYGGNNQGNAGHN
jgi:hypothetical protein